MDKKSTHDRFLLQIAEKGRRKLQAKNRNDITIWSQLGVLGIIGWTISFPIVMGAALGWFIDKKLGNGHRWALSLLVIGLIIGCWNAWYWISKQCKEIDGDHKKHDE